MKLATTSPMPRARGANAGTISATDAAAIPAPKASPVPWAIFCPLVCSSPSAGVEIIPVKVGIAKAAAVANPSPLAGSIFFGLCCLGCLGFFCKGPDIGIVGPLGMTVGPVGLGGLGGGGSITLPLADLRLLISTPLDGLG